MDNHQRLHRSTGIKQSIIGQWLWLSWKSGRFQYQRSAVQIQSLAKIYIYIEHLFTVNCVLKKRK